jgi:hypothetical protein
MNAALVALLAGLPWLTVLPLHGAAGVLAHVLTFVAALHGAGQALASLTRRQPCAPTLALQWGIAAFVALGGVAMVLHLFGFTAQIVAINVFAAIHTIVVVRYAPSYRAWLDALRRDRAWVIPVVLLITLGVFQLLAAAGDVNARPFDDDGNVLAQLQRLRDTGTLGDGFGYARHAQLGGQLVLTALVTVPGDVHLARALEPLAFALALALAFARLGVRDAFGALLGTLVLVGAVALAILPTDPVTCWTSVGLVLALHAALTDKSPPSGIIVGLLAGALVTLRFELAPIGIVALVVAWRRHKDSRLPLVFVALVTIAPYVVVRTLALRGVDTTLLLDHRLSRLVGLAVCAGVALACAPIALWSWPTPLRWFGVATPLTVAAIAGELSGDRPYALRFLWPLVLAFALLAVIELARARTLSTALMIATLVLGAVILHGRTTTGRVKWTRRYLDAATHLGYLDAVGDRAPLTGGYDELLRLVPPGRTVAVWVARPERLSYAGPCDIVDLRTPRTARRKLEALARASGAAYLLVEQDAPAHGVVAQGNAVQLVDLSR